VKIDSLEKLVDDKYAKLNGLELRLGELEMDHQNHKQQQEKKIKEIGNSCKQKTRKKMIINSTRA
jgi:hypothetical protein